MRFIRGWPAPSLGLSPVWRFFLVLPASLLICGMLNAQSCSTNEDCTSGNSCTVGQCNNGTCAYTTYPCNTSCTQDSDCNSGDVCVPGKCNAGQCTYSAFPCPPSGDPCTYMACVQQDSVATCVPTAIMCDNGNTCTVGQCIRSNGMRVCEYTPTMDGTACNDGNACTQTDTCQSGVCVGSNPIICNDNNACTADSCDPSTGSCLYTPVANTCQQAAYAANLTTLGDSFVNLTNSGDSDPGTGTLCANVYVFDPNEEELDCCSCQITPNALQSMSVTSLLSNNLTPEKPNSVVIQLLASQPAAGTCDPTTAGTAANPLAPGLHAWSTTLHQSGTGSNVTYGAETTFSGAAAVSQGELNTLTEQCAFILANGSGNGQCSGCSTGGR